MPKEKIIVINKEVNDILTKHFGGEISLIKGSKVTKLFDEALISNQMKKFLNAVKQAYTKSEKGDIKLKITYDLESKKEGKESKKIVIDDALNDILQEHFDSNIENTKGVTLQELFKGGDITKEQFNVLVALKKISKKKKLR